MKNIERFIKQRGGNVSVLDPTLDTLDDHKRDLIKRLKYQQKALKKAQERQWSTYVINDSIEKINSTLNVIDGM